MTTNDRISGFAWHLHHDVFIEWCYDYEGRCRVIDTDKPVGERELRRRRFQMVKGPLPADFVKAGADFVKARAAYDKAGAAYDKARADFVKAWADFVKAWADFVKAGAAYVKAWAAYDKAWAAFVKARAAYDKARAKAMPALLLLHAQECQDCPWDGTTIFPAKEDA